jgi:hypothetical protein
MLGLRTALVLCHTVGCLPVFAGGITAIGREPDQAILADVEPSGGRLIAGSFEAFGKLREYVGGAWLRNYGFVVEGPGKHDEQYGGGYGKSHEHSP